MRPLSRTIVFVLFGLLAWADAGALRLSECSRSDLAELGTRLPELRRAKRLGARTLAESNQTTEVLVKFHGRDQVLAFTVDSSDVVTVVERVELRNDVAFAEPNRRFQRQHVPSDPLLGNQWHHATIGSVDAWDWGTGSGGVKIAIVDVPFNLDHPDLAANSMNGWDVINEVPVYAGSDLHASMSAGMAAGVLGNGTGIAGAGNCTLVPVNNAYADLGTDTVQMDAAIRWAADHGIRVVNLSWDGADSSTLNLAAEYLRNTVDGVVVMAGINGSGYLDYTNQPHIIAVSMTDINDALQSHYGPHIDVSAPGYQVYSTSASGYTTDSGTSYAAPLVSGMLAMLFSIYPSLTADEALSILKVTAADLGASGWDQHYGWGRVDFGQAAWLAAAAAGSVPGLGRQHLKMADSSLTVAIEFHPGVAYRLLRATNLHQAVWSQVSAPVQTNGAAIEFSVEPEPGARAAFYKVVGELDF